MQNGQRGGAARLGAEQRRRQLAGTAALRFYRFGFHAVSLADVADAVGVTAPAVYRHFRNKNALLAGAIDSGLDVVDAAFGDAGSSLDELLFCLAGAALDRRDLWVLLQREMRHVTGQERVRLEARFGQFLSAFVARIQDDRPHEQRGEVALLATAALAILASPSVSKLRMARKDYQPVLAAAAAAVARVTLPAARDSGRPVAEPHSSETQLPRREELLETAITLFHERGYAAVSLDDIGAALGLTGPSIYHHFETKADLLAAAFSRAAHQLAVDGTGQLGEPSLDELVRRYIDAGVQQRHLFGVYVTEAINLPPEDSRRIAADLGANVEQWSGALQRERSALTETERLALVYAARGIVNDVVRVGHLHARPEVAEELQTLLRAVLEVDVA